MQRYIILCEIISLGENRPSSQGGCCVISSRHSKRKKKISIFTCYHTVTENVPVYLQYLLTLVTGSAISAAAYDGRNVTEA